MMLEWWQYALLACAGLLGGFIDAVAGGGGLITIPALLWAGLPPQVALGTNKLQSACGTMLAVWHYRKANLVRVRTLALGIVMTFVSSICGTWAVTQIDASFLRTFIPVLLLAIALWLAVKPQIGLESRPSRMSRTTFALVFGAALGFYDGFFGPGVASSGRGSSPPEARRMSDSAGTGTS